MPNPTDQPTNGSRRGTLFVLVLVAAVAVGLWLYFDRSEAPTSTDRVESTEPATDTAPGTDNTRTADAGAADSKDAAQTADAGATVQVEKPGAAEAGSEAPTDAARTTDDGADTQGGAPSITDSGTNTPTDVVQATDDGAPPRPEVPGTTAADTDPTGSAVASGTTDPDTEGSAVASGTTDTDPTGSTVASGAADTDPTGSTVASGTTDTDTKGPTDAARTADSASTGDAAPAPAGDDLVLAAAPEDTVEKTPIDAPPAAEPTGVGDILATVESAIEQVESAIREQLATEPESDADTELRVQVTYDDSRENAAQTDTGSTVAAGTKESDASTPADDAPTPDPDSGVGTRVANLTDPAGAAQLDVTQPADTVSAESQTGAESQTEAESQTGAEIQTEAEAKKFVETLTDTAPETIAVDKADHFVTQERVITLVPEDTIESVTVEELAKDETLTSDTPITVVREVEQIEPAVPEQLIADSGGDLDKPLRFRVTYDDSQTTTDQGGSGPVVVEEDVVEQMTVGEALERMRTEPKRTLSVIKKVRYFEVMTLRELLDTGMKSGTSLNVVTRPYRLESATLADLLERHKAENPDSIFYLHTVQDSDDQGIWGIVHFGLIDNFARGMAIRQGKDIETYTVRIPRDADERLEDQSSSFLGRLIDRKTKDSFVYNFRDDRMGRNPDRIYPGQEIVIIDFKPEELMSIYRRFESG